MAYEPGFEELINKMIYKANPDAVAAKNLTDTKYTIVVKTVVTEPGFQAVVIKKNPWCKYEIDIVENATKKVVASGKLKTAGVLMGGSEFDFDAINSNKECYAKAGKVIGKLLAKQIK